MKRPLWIRYFLPLLLLPLVLKGIDREMGPLDRDKLCTSCHSMKPFMEEYMKSTHYHGRTGIKASCVDCHLHGGIISVEGIRLLGRDLVYEVSRPIRNKEELEARRPRLAKTVRESLVETKSLPCMKCHPEYAMVPVKDRGKKAHRDMKATGESCIDCHYNLAHARVPWEKEKKEELDELLVEPR